MSANSKKGYDGERPLELYLRELVPGVYRPRAGQPRDVGDFGGLPFVVSAKNHAHWRLAEWVDGLEEMVVNADLDAGVVWHKRVRTGHPRRWYVTTTGALFEPFMKAYLDRRPG